MTASADPERLARAIQDGDVAVVRDLLDADPSLLIGPADEPSPALTALRAGRLALSDELAARCSPLSIFDAAAFEDTGRLAELITADRGVIESWNSEGWQPLHLAAAFGRSDAARALLDADAPADEPSRNAAAQRPLHLAAAKGHAETVWVLIASDVDVLSPDGQGRTALTFARDCGDEGCVDALLAAGA